jgi:hypothetical protein
MEHGGGSGVSRDFPLGTPWEKSKKKLEKLDISESTVEKKIIIFIWDLLDIDNGCNQRMIGEWP